MKHFNLKNPGVWSAGLTLAGSAVLATGCAEHPQTAYVPVYQAQPAYAAQPFYIPPPSPPPSSGTVAAPTSDWQQPAQPVAPAPVPAQPQPPPQPPAQAVVPATVAPPPTPVEVIPFAPGPTYVWAPGYYAWNGHWVWVGGHYVVRPRPGVVWVGGHWARHGHGYVWIGGAWR
jgi:hypothetical protein